jgi:5-(carboxyamino)imidazole ribonucleotide synthase
VPRRSRSARTAARKRAFSSSTAFPHAPYADIRSEADIAAANAGLFPGILKVARFGYDGKGQVRVAGREEALLAFRQLKNEACVLEQMLPLDYEVSVVLVARRRGHRKVLPHRREQPSQRHPRCLHRAGAHLGLPCRRPNEAEEIAEGIAQKMNYVGTLAVEFFIVRGQLLVNEMAPRPHNSGTTASMPASPTSSNSRCGR